MLKYLVLSACLLLAGPALAKDEKRPVWNYMGGALNDEGWGELSPDYANCDLGRNQSPINISETKTSAMPFLNVQYRNATVTVEKKDRTFVFHMKGADTLSDEGHAYRLEEMRIHTPSEHEIYGLSYMAELHLIHRDDKGQLLIVAVLIDVGGKDNPAVQQFLNKLPATANTPVPVTFNPAGLLPEKKGYYAYSGSLTWPPCTEGVEWRVMKGSITISKAQMQVIGKLLGRNARLTQPLYWRTVRETVD